MNRGGFNRARQRPTQPPIAWKSTGGGDAGTAMSGANAMGDVKAASLKVTKAAVPLAQSAAMNTPQGQTAKASHTFLTKILQDRKARKEAARVAREDQDARKAVAQLRAQHRQSKASPPPRRDGRRDGKGDHLLEPSFVSKPLPPVAPIPVLTPPSAPAPSPSGSGNKFLRYWEKGGF